MRRLPRQLGTVNKPLAAGDAGLHLVRDGGDRDMHYGCRPRPGRPGRGDHPAVSVPPTGSPTPCTTPTGTSCTPPRASTSRARIAPPRRPPTPCTTATASPSAAPPSPGGTAPSQSLPCATINADGMVTQLGYDCAGDLTSSATLDGNGSASSRPRPTLTTVTASRPAPLPRTATCPGRTPGTTPPSPATTLTATRRRCPRATAPAERLTPVPPPTGTTRTATRPRRQDARGYITTTTYNADDQATLVTNPDSDSDPDLLRRRR